MTGQANSQVKRVEAPPLPDRIEQWKRAIENERTLNDLVEDIHRVLVNESAEYRAYLRAVYDEHAVEGSLSADNIKAAEMIRERAKEIGSELAMSTAERPNGEKLATIAKALGVVLRRYHFSRKQRKNMLGGKMVPEENGAE